MNSDGLSTASYVGLPAVTPGDKEFASKTMANLSRAEWEDYKTRFGGYEDKLIDLVGNEGNVAAMVDRSNQAVDQSFDRARQGLALTHAKYGTRQDQTEAASSDRALSLSKASSKAGLQNAVRTHAYDRDMQIMAGSNVGSMKSITQE